MTPGKETFSSKAFRERDQRYQEKQQNEIKAIQRRHAFAEDAASVELFELKSQNQQLGKLLGYANVFEAIREIEAAGVEGSVREWLHRLQTTETRLELEKVEAETLRVRLEKVEKARRDVQNEKAELERVHRDLKAEHRQLKAKHRQLEAEKDELDNKYDLAIDTKKRAAERYKADYKKWKAFYNWLVSDEPDEKRPEVYVWEKRKVAKIKPQVMKKRQDIIDGLYDVSFILDGDRKDAIPSIAGHPLGGIEMESDKENDGTTLPPQKKRRISEGSTLASALNVNTPLQLTTNNPKPSTHKATLSTGRLPYIKQDNFPTPRSIRIKSFSSPSHPPRSSQRIPNSSDTEDDSQPTWIPPSQRPVMEPAPAALETSTVTPQAGSSKIIANPNQPRPSYALPTPARTVSRSSSPTRPQTSRMSPSKTLRHSPLQRSLNKPPLNTPNNFFSDKKGKERDKENDGSEITDEYSIFKGRGRYGKGKEAENTTINSVYAIDPANNGGLDYQFDEVIRTRDGRRKMHAGDCECCRDYYEGVGPLPDRLQRPLWRSPTSSPQKDRHARLGSTVRQVDIDSHKKAISRHRHMWARAPTPPGYWDIGFPNTQEVSVINEKATAMHKRKEAEVHKEAAHGGRYKRKY